MRPKSDENLINMNYYVLIKLTMASHQLDLYKFYIYYTNFSTLINQ